MFLRAAACKLYKMWAFDEKKRPRAVSANEPRYLQIMVRHLSQVFECVSRGRQGEPDLVAQHIKMCEVAIDILNVLGSQRERLDGATVRVLMLTLLGVADYLW